MSDFDELLERVKNLTGLSGRDAAQVAFELDDAPKPQEIIDKARELGFDVEKKHGQAKQDAAEPQTIAPEISMNPAEVLTEVYMVMPRVLCQKIPVLGRAPEQKEMEMFEEALAEMPEDIRALLVKIDLMEGQATFWLRDEANDVDRPIGPIDIKRYDSENALMEAFDVLLKRLPRVLSADWN